jgi:hypothetical protein
MNEHIEHITEDGRVFRAVGERPYVTKKGGTRILLTVWQGRCIECGEPFELFGENDAIYTS